MTYFYSAYRLLIRLLLSSPLLGWFGVRKERIQGFQQPLWKNNVAPPRGSRTIWFHAASTGELEMLAPLIEAAHERGLSVGVSVFSDSALPFLKKLPQGLVYSGLSPIDSEWEELFQKFQVARIIVSKYEAWPGLWIAASSLNIPLLIINAQYRRSLQLAKFLVRFFGKALPRLKFYALGKTAAQELEQAFPHMTVEESSDPRWIRVLERAEKVVKRSPPEIPALQKWIELGRTFPRPFVFVGSAWMEDLERVVPSFASLPENTAGTLWVVPHSLAPANLEKMRLFLERKIPSRFVLVAEMGILLELYSLADRAFVGGGYGKGIHSTIEPSVFGIPVACGPKKASFFYETQELVEGGILTLCSTDDEVKNWLLSPKRPGRLDFEGKKMSFARLVEESFQLR